MYGPEVTAVVEGMASAEQVTAIFNAIASIVESQKQHTEHNAAHQQRLIELTESQAQMNQRTHELREGQAQLHSQVQHISPGMVALHSKTAEMEARFEALKCKSKVGGAAEEDSAMGGDKKRKVEAPASQPQGQSGPWGSTPRVVYVGAGAGSSGDAPGGGGVVVGSARNDGADSDIKCRFVVKRMPVVIKSRLPMLLSGLYCFLGIDLILVQGGASATAYTSVVTAAAVVD